MARRASASGGADIRKKAHSNDIKFMGSFACTAGLWRAKNEWKPTYCMADVTDYKKVKNKAIEAYLAEEECQIVPILHREVVTM